MELISEMGGMDLYFHSSGYGKQNVDLAMDIERQTVLTNSYGFVQMVITAFNYFKKEKRSGRIAVISSVAGTKGLGAAPSYSATKRFDWTYIEALAQLAHIQKLDIRFTDIRPGFVATDFIAGDSYPMEMHTDYVVRHILKAVRNGKRKVIIDWKYRILCFFWRHIPSFLWERLNIHN
jgi:short-subunit dehydrogenase